MKRTGLAVDAWPAEQLKRFPLRRSSKGEIADVLRALATFNNAIDDVFRSKVVWVDFDVGCSGLMSPDTSIGG